MNRHLEEFPWRIVDLADGSTTGDSSLVILDVILPGRGGFQVCQTL